MTDSPIFAGLEREAGHIRDEAEQEARRLAHRVSDRFRHHGYPDRNTPAPVPEESPVSLITEVKTGLHDIIAKLEQVDEAAAAKLESAQANPGIMKLVDAGLAAVHVPPQAFDLAVSAVEGLEKLYNPAQEAAAPAEAAPAAADGATPEAGTVADEPAAQPAA
jgi:hypothetical protein